MRVRINVTSFLYRQSTVDYLVGEMGSVAAPDRGSTDTDRPSPHTLATPFLVQHRLSYTFARPTQA